MFDIYKVFAKSGEFKGYKNKPYLGEIIVHEDDEPMGVALKTYDRLTEEEIECVYKRKLSINRHGLSVYNDKYYIDINYSDDYFMDFVSEDDIVKLALFHNSYNLPNNVDFTSDNFENWDDMKKNIMEDFEPVVIEPISMTDHSGLFVCKGVVNDWDSGQIGFAFIPKETQEEFGLSYEQCEKILNNRIKELENHVAGEVFFATVFDLENKPGREVEYIEVIGVFYGSDFNKNGLYNAVEDVIGETLNYDELKSVY